MSSQLHNTWHESSCGVFQRGSPLWLHELALFPSQFNHLRIHKILFPFYLAIYRCTSQMGHIDAKRGNRNLSLFLLNWIIYLFYHFNICLLAQSRTHIRVRSAHNRCDQSRLCLVEMQRGEEQRRNYYKEKWVYDHAGGLYPIAIYNIINVCFIRFLLYFVSQKWRQTTTTKKCNKYVVALPHSRKKWYNKRNVCVRISCRQRATQRGSEESPTFLLCRPCCSRSHRRVTYLKLHREKKSTEQQDATI